MASTCSSCAAAVLACCLGPALAAGERSPIIVGERFTVVLGSHAEIYPPPVADPEGADFGLIPAHFSRSEIPEAGSPRVILKLGGRFGLVRVHRNDAPERPFQLEIEAGFLGVFDTDHSLDNIGWDGIYGFHVVHRRSPSLALRLGTHHTSSHVGDEYAERTGRQRISYTREEILAGALWSPAPRVRVYLEGGWAGLRSNRRPQEPWRVQIALEYTADQAIWQGRLGWYAGASVNLTEERDWRPGTSLQAGLSLPGPARRWRIGIQHYSGRSILGEFFLHDETFTAAGIWLDIQ
jgi:hypothetical protein